LIICADHGQCFEKGILHRDPSGGNILIAIPDDPNAGTEGFLIDLDHAKVTNKFTKWKKEEPLNPAEIKKVMDFLLCQERTVKMAVAAVGLESAAILHYIDQVSKRLGIKSTPESPLAPEQLGWIDTVRSRGFNQSMLDFSSRYPRLIMNGLALTLIFREVV
jgi:hypothetical protein